MPIKVGSEVVTGQGFGYVTDICGDGMCWVELADGDERMFVIELIEVIDGEACD